LKVHCPTVFDSLLFIAPLLLYSYRRRGEVYLVVLAMIFLLLFLIACGNAIIAAKTGNDMLGAMGWVLVAWLSVGMWQVDCIGSRPWRSECEDATRAH